MAERSYDERIHPQMKAEGKPLDAFFEIAAGTLRDGRAVRLLAEKDSLLPHPAILMVLEDSPPQFYRRDSTVTFEEPAGAQEEHDDEEGT